MSEKLIPAGVILSGAVLGAFAAKVITEVPERLVAGIERDAGTAIGAMQRSSKTTLTARRDNRMSPWKCGPAKYNFIHQLTLGLSTPETTDGDEPVNTLQIEHLFAPHLLSSLVERRAYSLDLDQAGNRLRRIYDTHIGTIDCEDEQGGYSMDNTFVPGPLEIRRVCALARQAVEATTVWAKPNETPGLRKFHWDRL